jgi:phosphoribosylglycinamide formyltransferase 1
VALGHRKEAMAHAKARLAILLSGRGSNMEVLLRETREGILKDCCEVALVFANRADAPGLTLARELGAPTACIESAEKPREAFDSQLLALLEPHRIDYLVLAGFMRLLSPAVIHRYPGRIVNIHPADTKKHQGLEGYRWAFESCLEKTTVTVHLVDEGLDTGRILAQRDVALSGASTVDEVERRGREVEHALYPEALRELCKEVVPPGN